MTQQSKTNLPIATASGTSLSALAKVQSTFKTWQEKLAAWIEGDGTAKPEWPEQMPKTPFEMARAPIIMGLVTVIGCFGLFLIWSLTAPLSSAAIATGLVTVDSNRKEVQHLEGGIVKEILVKEGARVNEGDILVRIDDTRTSASVDLLLGQYRSAMARVASLQAEQEDRETPNYPPELLSQRHDPLVRDIMDSQTNLFLSRKISLRGQLDVLEQQVKQFEEEITGLNAQKTSESQQLELIKEEIIGVQELFDKGLERKPRLLALERKATEISGRVGQFQAEIARANQSILQNELSIRDTVNRFKSDSAEQLREAENQYADLTERLRASENQQARTEIIAPKTGTVVNLKVHTIGGVISPGETVLEIVPIDDTLIVEARVNPRDIDVVRAGLSAQVVLTAYNTRRTPYLKALVQQVSADILRDTVTGQQYYSARIEVDATNLKDYPDIALYPGMPVEVMIETGKRTAMQYILAPFRGTLRRGAREL